MIVPLKSAIVTRSARAESSSVVCAKKRINEDEQDQLIVRDEKIYMYKYTYINNDPAEVCHRDAQRARRQQLSSLCTRTLGGKGKGCNEKHSHTTAHHPVVKPPAEVSTVVSHTPTQQQGWGDYQELSCSLIEG